MPKCSNCGEEKICWGLRHYYGISGHFCAECYEKVSHDAYGNPNHPGEYTLMLLKLSDLKLRV